VYKAKPCNTACAPSGARGSEVAERPARACGCSFCREHGGVWASCPAGGRSIAIADRERVTRDAFGTGTAEFLVCANCGVVPVAISEISGNTYAVVNVNTFEAFDPSRLLRSSSDFDDEDEATRLARRARNWIGRVQIRYRGET
jgi:hypothetical protein